MTKTIYLLNIGNYAPQLTALCYPFIRHYADKLHAHVHIIKDRKFPDWPITYEKLNIYQLAKEYRSDWNIYIDSDTLIHPECIDFTEHMNKDTVLHHGSDMANIRWSYDDYFRRDGRNIGSCNWFTIASNYCVDIWRPHDDLTPEQAIANIHPTAEEVRCGITAEHLIDDYTLSRNIARFGLKFERVPQVLERVGLKDAGFFHHEYTIPVPEKIDHIKRVLREWKINLEDWLPSKQVKEVVAA